MKKLRILFIVFALTLISCGSEETISEKERRLEKEAKKGLIDVPTTRVEFAPIEESIEKVVHVTYTTVPTDSSYWYVVMKDDVTNWHGTVEFATPYFDFIEAKTIYWL